MTLLFQIGIFPIVLTLLCYQTGVLLQRKLRSPICNPILIGAVLVLVFMALTGLDNTTYQSSMKNLSWLMTPATISLAIPMYEQFDLLRKNLRAIVAGVAAGAIGCLAMVLVFSLTAGFDRSLMVSLLPKSVTSAIGVPLSELSGGIGAVTTSAIILSGIIAASLALPLCRLFRLSSPVAQGVAMGTSGHAIATSKANEMGPLTVAVSSLSLVTAGLLTSVVFPVVMGLL